LSDVSTMTRTALRLAELDRSALREEGLGMRGICLAATDCARPFRVAALR